MKQFIYLDSDIVNSIIAQNEKGLVQGKKFEDGQESTENAKNMMSTDITGGVKGGFFNLINAEGKVNLNAEIGKESDISNIHREIIEKSLHDAAFDIAYNYINVNDLKVGDGQNDDYGEYVELTRVFDFVDLDYLNGLFDKEGLIDFIKKTSAQEIKNNVAMATNNLNRQQIRIAANKINNEIKKTINENNQEYDNVRDIIKAFKKMIPYSKMLISGDGYLIPLDEKYFRVNPSSIGFMYGGNITCVGMITNIIGKDTNPEDNKNIFATLQFSVNEALRGLLPTKEDNICIIHPIAIFYNK